MLGRENAGISSKNVGENPTHRKPKVSWATRIDPGLGGPKASPAPFEFNSLLNLEGAGVVDG